MAGLEVLHRPGKIPGDRSQHRRSEAVYGPRVGEVRLTRLRRKADQVRAVHVEQLDDAPERVGDRGVDARRGEVDEARRQLREQPLEREDPVAGRGTGRDRGVDVDPRGAQTRGPRACAGAEF
jgi:hypothetical protein